MAVPNDHKGPVVSQWKSHQLSRPTKICSTALVSLYFALMHGKPFDPSQVIGQKIYFVSECGSVGLGVKQKAANRREAPRKTATWRVIYGDTLEFYTEWSYTDLGEGLILGQRSHTSLMCRSVWAPILVCWCCHNRISQTRWLVNNRNVFLTALEAASLRSGCQHGWVRALF